MQTKLTWITLTALLFTILRQPGFAQDNLNSQLQSITQQVNELEAKQHQLLEIAGRDAAGAALFLFGAFCALWAQNTNRNAWLWFFMGLLFNVITVIVLLVKNSGDRRTVAQASD
jgi:hypothetical protein